VVKPFPGIRFENYTHFRELFF